MHAAGESAQGPLPSGTNAVVLKVDSETDLTRLHDRLTQADIPHTSIHEPDAPWNGQMTAIGLAPLVDRARVRPILRNLQLL